MNRWFVLSQGPQSTELDCYQVRADKVIHHGLITADVLKRQAGDDPVVIVVTGHLWSCVDVVLPKVKSALLRKALPSMVEESILSSTEDIHCVLPAVYTPGGPCTVLVIARVTMHAWLEWAKNLGLQLQAIIPAHTLLPIMTDHIGMMVYGNMLWIRHDAIKGDCIPIELAKPLLDKLITGEEIDLYGEIDQALRQKLNHVHPQMLRLKDCLLHAEEFPINLLQSDFKVHKPRHKKSLNALTLSIGFMAVALVVHMVYLGVSHIVLSSRLAMLKQETLALYQKVYPEASTVSSPKVLISRALGQETAGDQGLSSILSALTQATIAYPIQMQQLEYRDHRLTLRGRVADFTQLDGIMKQLQDQGYTVTQQKAEQMSDAVEIALLISRGG